MPEDSETMRMVRSAVSSVRSTLTALPVGDLAGDGGSVEGLLSEVVAAERQLSELRLRVVRVADAQREAARTAAAGTDAWLAALTGTSRGQAAGGLWLARALAEDFESVRLAFARGELSMEAARVIVRAASSVPRTVTTAERDECVAALVARAVDERLDPARLRRAARRMLDRLDPASADRHQATLLEDEERQADVWFTMHETARGDWEGRFSLPAMHAHLLRTAIEHLTAPRRLSRNRAGEPVTDESAPSAPGWHAVQGRALGEIIEHLPRDGWDRGGRMAAVMVHLDHAHLLDGLAAAHLDTGSDVSAREARRLACDAGIIPRSSAARRCRWTSGASDGSSRRPSTPHSPRSTTPAPPRAAAGPSRGPSCTMWTGGATADPPTWPTPSRCAGGTTTASTTRPTATASCPAGRSASGTGSAASDHRSPARRDAEPISSAASPPRPARPARPGRARRGRHRGR